MGNRSVFHRLVCCCVFVVVFVAVNARRKYLRIRRTPDFVEPHDEWEVNSHDMTLLDKLGDGFFAVVYRAFLYHSSSRGFLRQGKKEAKSFEKEKSVVVCKMLKGAQSRVVVCVCSISQIVLDEIVQGEDFLKEIKLMKRIGQHPHIVSLLACITTSPPYCLIVEYCMHGDLLNYLRKRRPKVDEIPKRVVTNEILCLSV